MNQIINMFMRIVLRKVMNKGVGKGIDSLRMLNDAANIIQRNVRQSTVLLAAEQVLTGFGQ